MCLFRNRIYECFNVNFFKNEESDKMSAKGAHVQETNEGESTNSSVSSSPHSPIIDAEYVFISKYIYYFRHYVVGGYYFIINFMKIFPN